MTQFDDLTGEFINGIYVIKLLKKGKSRNTWLCLCPKCKEEFKIVGGRTKLNSISQCKGCSISEKKSTHKMSKSRIYHIHSKMISRCYNDNNKDYEHYGGRGIKIYDEWLGDNGFINFYNWAIENGYNDNLTIDRIDVNGNYEPNNCRWTDIKTQENNRTNSRIINFRGETHTLSQWAEILGFNYFTLSTRIYYRNWDIEKAFTTPVKERNKK